MERRLLFAGSPLTALPQLNSNSAGASAIYLDFIGAPAQSWNGHNVPQTPAFDVDGDPLTFSSTELADIQQIWAGVAEKYSPFNINVTTVAPANLAHNLNMEIVIGGDSNWTGGVTGGVSIVGAYSSIILDNVSFIFPANLSNDPGIIADGAAHEAGHEFGLYHQSLYDAKGNLITTYNPGDALTAPIMGLAYYSQRGLWWRGTNEISSTTIQDDLAVIAAAPNVGYRAQDHGQSITAANPMSVSGSVVSGTGVIAKTTDSDYFSFTSGAGAVSLAVNVAASVAMLRAKVQLFNSTGTLLATAADPASLGQAINATLPAAGTYYLAVESFGQYGDIGQYSVTGTIAPAGAITLVQSPDHLHIDWGQGTTSGTILINDPSGLTLHGDGQNDPITLDYTNGNPIPANLHLDGTFTINGLQGTNPLAGKTLEIAQSTVYVRYANTGSDPIAAIKGYLANGYNAGAWNGTPTASTGVITSLSAQTNALHNTGIGYADFSDGTGVNPTPNTILLKYAVLGDADLDGTVGLSDYTSVVRNFATGAAWDQGAVTYAASVGLADYTTVVRNFGVSVPIAPSIGVSAAQFALTTTSVGSADPVNSPDGIAKNSRYGANKRVRAERHH